MVTAASRRLDDEGRWEELEFTLLDALQDMGASGVGGWGRVNELGAVFSVEAPALTQAASAGAELFQHALEKIGGPPAARIEVEPAADHDRDGPVLERRLTTAGPSVPAVSASEVAQLLGISRQRVYQLLEEREDFPRPAAETPRGAVWDRRDVEHWHRRTRKPGRPRKNQVRA